ncbi:hypothetical protein P3T76_014166 [Phytophthora citrophthora]|uniref:Uncharacterized protein n=1 Tax=Phytophthora citrophthora TaxID=4793 RepID=A0AAD9G2E1_9STRA|nr:hypothetical protein P3T76_014166 [Phytophthora citrophthora]
MSFAALRRLVFRKGDHGLIKANDFVDNVYQTHARYLMEMRAALPMHWTLVERTSGFSKGMQPHLKKPATMGAQPRVFCVIKGTH